MILREKFSPMCFLSSLGAGGLSVSFFMYLMFLVPHPNTPIATYDFIVPALLKGDWLSIVSFLSLILIIVFAYLHFKLLIWNTKQFNLYKKTKNYEDLLNSNSQITLMTIPLTYTMSINVCFILGAVFIPGLWGIVEYLFPFSVISFAIAGYYALKIFINYFTRLLTKGDFDFSKNNNLSQMVSIFAFSMVAVGFAAPAAMSHNIIINTIGIFAALFFATVAVLFMFIQITIGFKNMLEQGLGLETAPSIWIIIPILTLLGITIIRILFSLEHNFNTPFSKSSLFVLTSIILSLQIVFGILGYIVMKKMGYFEMYIESANRSAISFALICPGVAFMVFGMFFINYGLVFNNIVEKYSIAHFIVIVPFFYIQMKTISYFFKLYKKFSF